MMLLNNLINRIKTPVPVADRIMEFVLGIMIIILLITTAILYGMAPRVVPTEFRFDGTAGSTSEKMYYWYIAVTFTLCIAAIFIGAYYPEYAVSPRRQHMTEHQKMLCSRLCRVINISITLLWLTFMLTSSSGFLNISRETNSVMFAISAAAIIIPTVYYSLKIWFFK